MRLHLTQKVATRCRLPDRNTGEGFGVEHYKAQRALEAGTCDHAGIHRFVRDQLVFGRRGSHLFAPAGFEQALELAVKALRVSSDSLL